MRYLGWKSKENGTENAISASLISAEDGATLWSHNFDTTLDDIFDIQDELVETIVSNIVGNVKEIRLKNWQIKSQKNGNMI